MDNLGKYIVPEETRNGICVDIGANVGNFFKKYKDFFSLIHFYEPYKECYDICTQEKFLNIKGFNEAVSDKEGFVSLLQHMNGESGSNTIKNENSLIFPGWKENQKIIQEMIPSISLETVLNRVGGKIDYLKCDAENSEYFIFLNKNLNNILYIGMEIHCQMGKERYNQLLKHMLKTHEIISGNFDYNPHQNREILLKNKNEK